MSIQLIVYPQSFNGLNAISGVGTEQVVDGINFNTFNTSAVTINVPTPTYQNAINTINPTMVVNTWYRFSAGSAAAAPYLSPGGVQVPNTTGFLQKLSNLIAGETYEVTIETVTAVTGIELIVYNGTVQQSYTPFSIVGTNTFQFVASSSSDTIMLYSSGPINIITSISIRQAAPRPSGAIQDLSAGQVILDLYEDEDIPVTLSVDDFKNVAEQVQSYSKAFNLPATKRNNQIFDNVFEITRADDGIIFNPYVKTQCELKQDGFILFEGYLRLIEIQDKEGEISYDVNLYSEVIAFADVLQDKTFEDLSTTFSELSHLYNYSEIRNSWQGILGLENPLPAGSFAGAAGASTTNVLKYPNVDYNHSYTIDSSGNPVLPNLESMFRPFIRIKYLIQNIFQATKFSYTSNFIDNDVNFQKLYMDFNWGGDEFPSPTNTFAANWTFGTGATSNVGNGTFKALQLISENVGGVAGSVLPPNYQEDPTLANPFIITATNNNEIYNISYVYRLQRTGSVGVTAVCRWVKNKGLTTEQHFNVDNLVFSLSNNQQYSGVLNVTLDIGDTLEAQFKVSSSVEQSIIPSRVVFNQSTTLLNSAGLLSLRGEVSQWDFIKGIMTMFNLVSVPDKANPNNIIIEPYNEIFLNNPDSKRLDWSDKVDISEMKLTPLTDLNKKTIFKFIEDDDDWAFMNYKRQVEGHLYGSKVYDASGFTILTGEKEVVAEPFAATVSKPLMPLYYDFIIPSLYAYNPDDGTSEAFDNSPRIMFENGIKTATAGTFSSCTYNVPPQNCTLPCGDATEDEFLQFSHLTNIPTQATTSDFHFGECQLIDPIGNSPIDNLFNTYWLPYFNELYNPDTRTMTLKVNLTAGDINTFNFFDTVFIKNREFRVNKIDYKPNDLATVEFILIP
tara:strand:- start:765 stop:3464 length:2700 start_codon:yes stop_codon:yes gene_type:complete